MARLRDHAPLKSSLARNTGQVPRHRHEIRPAFATKFGAARSVLAPRYWAIPCICRDDHIDVEAHKVASEFFATLWPSFVPARLERDIAVFNISEVTHAVPKCVVDDGGERARGGDSGCKYARREDVAASGGYRCSFAFSLVDCSRTLLDCSIA